jgi:hypothetical protein
LAPRFCGSSLHIFDLTGDRFLEVLNIDSRIEAENQVLNRIDVERTAKTHGTEFCFVQTTLAEKGVPLKPPKLITFAGPGALVLNQVLTPIAIRC